MAEGVVLGGITKVEVAQAKILTAQLPLPQVFSGAWPNWKKELREVLQERAAARAATVPFDTSNLEFLKRLTMILSTII